VAPEPPRAGARGQAALARLHPLVHPWWPIHDAWLYGDRVFVLEPWLWTLLIPALVTRPGWNRGRWVLLTLFLLVLGLAASTGRVATGVLTALPVAFALGWAMATRLSIVTNTAGMALAGVVVLVTAMGNLSVRVKQAARAAAPGVAHDVIVSPAPADPRCWRVMTVEGDEATDTYRVRRGAWSLSGKDAEACRDRVPDRTVAPLVPSELPDTPALAWRGQFVGKLSELRRLAREHCRFEKLLQFARAPSWHRGDDGNWQYGDLRFDRGRRAGFAQMVDPEGAAASCGDVWPAPWIPPVQPLLTDTPTTDSTKEKP
jgi:inner membrane protein